MDEKYIQIREHREEGYRPVVAFGAWRVAFLNTAPRFRRENMRQLERHLLTDETFTLLKGRAALYIGDGDGEHAGQIEVFDMEPLKLYNVRAGVWHAIETAEDTSVMITENDNTAAENSPKLPVTPDMFPQWDPKG